ncbi:hypothetical protein DUW70_01420 [Stenotrophomonas maltophilia]|nr:hypothetical protein DUW70_01420 [Stenotrophomonas maltophilia]
MGVRMVRTEAVEGRIDWFRLLDELARAGVPVSSVAQHMSVPRSTILGWKQGAEPKYRDGELLLDLWMAMTGRSRHEAPRT